MDGAAALVAPLEDETIVVRTTSLAREYRLVNEASKPLARIEIEIGTDTYLALANYYNGSTHTLASKIYRWDGGDFVELQMITTSGAWDWEFFTIGADSYLAYASYYTGSSYSTISKS